MKYKNSKNKFKAKFKFGHDDAQQIKDFDRAFDEFLNYWVNILGPDVLKVRYKGTADKKNFSGGR